MERRDQQNLTLTPNTHLACNGGISEHKPDISSVSRWVRLGSRASRKGVVFNNLLTHINVDSLKEAFKAQDGSKALGVDGISKEVYGKKLDENLVNLALRVQRGTYRPMPKREVLIPKGNGKVRPIAIGCFEDKLVDCKSTTLPTLFNL